MTIQPNEIKEYCYMCDDLVVIIPKCLNDGSVLWKCSICGRGIEYDFDVDGYA